jgi:hypothetical protein
MTAIIDTTGLAHLVAVVERCRRHQPIWEAAGIRRYVELALAHHPYGHVARIAIGAALDPTAHTPGVIPTRCDNGWVGSDTEPPTRTPPRVTDMRCPNCGLWITLWEDHACARRIDPGAAAEYAALARKAAQAGRTIARARANAAPEETP